MCVNSTGSYFSVNGQPTNWTLTNSAGIIVDSAVNSTSYSYLFGTIGTYKLSAGLGGNCPAQQFLITVLPRPSSPQLSDVSVLQTDGTLVSASSLPVCPNAPYTYSVLADSAVQYRWEVAPSVGSIIGSAIGNQVSISFTGTAPAVIKLYRESISPIVCPSSPLLIPINFEIINASISAAHDVVCSNSIEYYQAVITGSSPEELYIEGETYTWSITPNTLGSVISGQGTQSIGIQWNNTASLSNATLTLVINKCTLAPLVINKAIIINPVPQIAIVPSVTSICSGSTMTFDVVSTVAGVPLTSGTVTWNFGGTIVTGSILDQAATFENLTSANIGQTVTAIVTDANGCGASTNTASYTMTVLPGPPAALSRSYGGNAFCTKPQIYTVLTVSSATEGVTFQWYKNNILIEDLPLTTTSLTITGDYLAFGSYHFVATNIAGCSTVSNKQLIVRICPEEPCDYSPEPYITNTSTQSCGLITLAGTASGSPQNTFWKIVGPPNVNLINNTGAPYMATAAGDFHIYHTGVYLNTSTGIECAFSSHEKVTVPYIPDFSYIPTCNGNSTFTINFIDKTSFYSLVGSRVVNYYYRPVTSPESGWIIVSGSTIPSLPAGSYEFKIAVSGVYDSVNQGICEKVLSETLGTVPNRTIVTSNNLCHDSAVKFNLSGIAQTGDSYLWTFYEGTIIDASSTLPAPYRVFPTSGVKTIKVVVTNKFGCSREFSKNVTIPEKCFNGTIVATPNPPIVCAGSFVNLQYMPSGTECTPTEYIWMNGQNVIPTAPGTSSINVGTAGFYWVKVKKGSCTYETPNRITPLFKTLPNVRIEVPSAVCFGTPIVGSSISDATYLQWHVDGVLYPAGNNLATVTFYSLTLGIHTISVTAYSGDPALASSCFSVASQTVTVFNPPSAPVINYTVVCAGEDVAQPYYHVNLTATSATPGVFNWSNGATGSSITVLDGGPYEVSVTNGGCSTSTLVNVPRSPEDYIWIFPAGCTSTCVDHGGYPSLIGPRLPLSEWTWLVDGTPELSGTNSFATAFDIPVTNAINLEITTGSCGLMSPTLDFSGNNECKKCDITAVDVESMVSVGGPFCSFEVTLNLTISDDIVATLVAPNDDFVVSPSQFNLNTGTNQIVVTIVPLGTFLGGTVLFEIDGVDKDGKPCIFQFDMEVSSCSAMARALPATKVDRMPITKAVLQMAPNPADGEVIISYANVAADSSISLYDLTGRMLADFTLITDKGMVAVPTATYAAGTYIVVLRSNGTLVVQQKLLKK